MDRFHGNSLGLAYLADQWIGPVKRAATGSRFCRFHPYSGTSCGGGLHESFAARSGIASYMLPLANYAMLTSQFVPYTIIPEPEMLSGTGAILMQALMQQDALAYSTTNVASTTAPLSTLYQLCSSESKPRHSPCSSAIDKQRIHPFYCRQLKEPAEGMTRTRDKYRIVYTDKQRKGLEAEYKTNKFITMQRKLELITELNLSDRQIKIWFQNRRAKERRDSRMNSDDSLSDSDKTAENDNNLVQVLEKAVNNNMASMIPGYNAENQVQINEPRMTTFSTGQCRFMSSEDNYTTSDCAQSKFGEPHKQALLPRLSVSPSEWNHTSNNGYSGYNSTVNVSPINMDFCFGPRL